MNTQKERMEAFISYKNLTNKGFEEKCGLGNGFVSKIGKNIRESKLELISKTFPDLNIEWIETGKGSMLLNALENEKEAHINNRTSFHAIKYYPAVNGSMGGVEFLDNPNESSVDIVIPGFSDCKFAVNAYGDSMYPIIKSGQIVVMMEWKESFIDWGRIYFVVTKNGYRAIKYLKPSEKEGYIKCESENATGNPAFDVEINDIHRLFLVKGWICREAI